MFARRREGIWYARSALLRYVLPLRVATPPTTKKLYCRRQRPRHRGTLFGALLTLLLFKLDQKQQQSSALMFVARRTLRTIGSINPNNVQSYKDALSSSPRLRQRRRRQQYGTSRIVMMPEGPEVRTLVDQLQAGGVGCRLVDVCFVSGRYSHKNKSPVGFSEFASTMTQWWSPTTNPPPQNDPPCVDTIVEWNCKGKFMYIVLDQGAAAGGQKDSDGMASNDTDSDATIENDDPSDFQRSIWITLGMTGRFLSQAALAEREREGKTSHVRWYLELVRNSAGIGNEQDDEPPSTIKIFYADTRNFGTLKFCLSRDALTEKLRSLGPDMLSASTTEAQFRQVWARTNQTKNVCKFLMDQSKLCGVGNYILAEGLYRAEIDPFAALCELDSLQQRQLFHELVAVTTESYLSQRTEDTGNNNSDGSTEFEMQCYGRAECLRHGEPVQRESKGPHGRTIWYTNRQLFMSRERRSELEIVPLGENHDRIKLSNRKSDATAASTPQHPTPRAASSTKLVSGNTKFQTNEASVNKDESARDGRILASSIATANSPGNAMLAAILAGTPVESSSSMPTVDPNTERTTGSGTDDTAQLESQADPSNMSDNTASSSIATANTPGNAKLASILAGTGTPVESSSIPTGDPNTVRTTDSVADKAPKLESMQSISASNVEPSKLDDDTAVNSIVQSSSVSSSLDESTLVSLLLSHITEEGWTEALIPLLSKSAAVGELAVFLEQERQRGIAVYPPTHEIFAALNLCPLEKTRVVIVGQDPYHGAGQGHGLAFSVRKGVRVPPSLRNIFSEAMNSAKIAPPQHGNLESWASQGVLLLNTVLTVQQGQANSHAKKGWEEVTDAIIQVVSERNERADSGGLVFLLWGRAAAKKVGSVIDEDSGHTILQSSHPSPLGASKTKAPFLGSQCFGDANKALVRMGYDRIDWNVY